MRVRHVSQIRSSVGLTQTMLTVSSRFAAATIDLLTLELEWAAHIEQERRWPVLPRDTPSRRAIVAASVSPTLSSSSSFTRFAFPGTW